MSKTTIEINLGGKLGRAQKLAESNTAMMREIIQAWTRIYTAFIRRRFVKASRGDGTWPDLAPSTKARRRKGRKGKADAVAILRNTGLLFSQLAPNIEQLTRYVTGNNFAAYATYGGLQKYPGGKVTVTDVMAFHQEGGPNLPQRKILVPPDAKTKEQMARSAKRIIAKYLNNG